MQRSLWRSAITLPFVLATAPLASSQVTASYEVLDRVEGAHVLLNSAPVRPMALDSNNDVWAINHHDNTVERFEIDVSSVRPKDVYPVPWGPVSLATYPGGQNGEELLVVCRNTWCLARLDRATGQTLEVIPLDAEPGDILRLGDYAWISCMGADSVRQIDLRHYSGNHEPGAAPGFVDARYDESTHSAFQIKSPLGLSAGPQLTGPTIVVTPLHSGNNTTATGTDPNAAEFVVSLAGFADQLPDQDMFLIDPLAPSSSQVVPVPGARGLGTLLFTHGTDAFGRVWVGNTEALNTLDQTEEGLSGIFAENRMSVFDPSTLTTTYVGLDPYPTPSVFDSTNTVAQPYSIAFHPDGRVFTAGMGTDNVAEFTSTPSPAFQREWDLVDGAIPRGLLVGDFGTGSGSRPLLLIYCWGTNTIEVHDPSMTDPTASGVPDRRLSYDPTPERVADGRRTFFDAANSLHGNLSCATCHFDGGSDFLVWNLSSGPSVTVLPVHSIDDKGPMVTQTLVGLQRLAPFHWRGERQFEDFNEFAFPGLLGNPSGPLEEEDFQKMKEFVFALVNPANPNQSRDRVLDGSIHFPGTSPDLDPDVWQTRFLQDKDFLGRFACVECHALPSGTNNDVFVDGTLLPERAHFKTTAFHELWRKFQTTDSISIGGGTRAFLGAGTSHSGVTTDIRDFTNIAIADVAVLDDVTNYIHQWDQGLGKAVHHAFLLSKDTDTDPLGQFDATTELAQFLEPQAAARNCDLVVFGSRWNGIGFDDMRWFFDRYDTSGSPYRAEDSTVPNRSLADFRTGATTFDEEHTFVGLPVGMGQRLGVDKDLDAIFNADEATPLAVVTVNPGAVPGDPSILDSPFPGQVDWITTKATRVTFDTSEPTTAELRYREVGVSTWNVAADPDPQLGTTHSFVLTDLRPSTRIGSPGLFTTEDVDYEVQLVCHDIDGNSNNFTAVEANGGFTTQPFILPDDLNAATLELDRLLLEEHIIASKPQLSVSAPVTVGSTERVDVNVRFTTAFKAHGGDDPAIDRVFVCRVWKQPTGGSLQQLDAASSVDPMGAGAGSLWAEEVQLETSTGTSPLDVHGPFLLTRGATELTLSGTEAEVDLGFTLIDFATSGDDVVVTVEAVVETTDVPQYESDVSTFSCVTTCMFSIPVDSVRATTQWDFPSTTEHRFKVRATVP